VPMDLELNETYFIVAHLHYVLLGINVFPVIGGIHFWFPKFSGRMMSERLGKWSFWIMFVGFNLGFFPMHISGLLGMPRRIYTYPEGMGWDTVNMVTSIGSFIFALGILMFLINLAISLKRGAPAGDNPWDAATLEWSIPSPPPKYNFAVIPLIRSRHPLWESRLDPDGPRSSLQVGYLLADGRETMGTTPLAAIPDSILKMPDDSYAPFWLGLFLFLFFSTLVLRLWLSAGLMLLGCALALAVWLWPRGQLGQRAAGLPEPTGAAP